jgi:transcriptional regulator with XRE-family HTH domain
MTAADLRTFVGHMGWSERETARRLGVSQNGLRRWLAGVSPVPLTIALACSALAYGLPPWRY